MDPYSFTVNGDVGAAKVDPCAGVEVLNSVALHLQRHMRVSAEYPLSFALFCVAERALCYLRRQAQPSGVEAVKVAGKLFASGIDLLQPQVDELSEVAELQVPDSEGIELVTVDRQMPFSVVAPFVFLVNGNPDEMRHHWREPVIVVAFHPNHLNAMFGIGQLANVAEELPVLLGEPAKIEVGKNIAQQDQPAELHRAQKIQRVRGSADFRAQVQVGNDHGIKTLFPHALLL